MNLRLKWCMKTCLYQTRTSYEKVMEILKDISSVALLSQTYWLRWLLVLSCVIMEYTTGELLVQGQHKRRKDETIYDFIFWWKDKSRENIIEIESTTVYWIET